MVENLHVYEDLMKFAMINVPNVSMLFPSLIVY